MPTYIITLEAGEGQETRTFEADDDIDAVNHLAGVLEKQLKWGLYGSDVFVLERAASPRSKARRLFSGSVDKFAEYANKTFEAEHAGRFGL